MKLLTLEQTPDRFGGRVYRTSPLAAIIMLIVVGALAVAAPCAWYRGRIPFWALLPIGLLLLLFGLLLSTVVIRAFAPANWLLVLTPGQILLKFRQDLRCHPPRPTRLQHGPHRGREVRRRTDRLTKYNLVKIRR